MSFHRQRLQQLRRAAGLDPMPAFLRDYGGLLAGDEESAYIDSRYFSPEGLRWADAAAEYRAQGGTLSRDDEECFARVWTAMRAGRKPTDAQRKESDKNWKWRRAESRIPELYALEMQRRGVRQYGPDYELPPGIKSPGSGQELIYRYLHSDLGYATPESAKANHNSWKHEQRKRASLVSASP